MNTSVMETLVTGLSNDLTGAAKARILKSIQAVDKQLEDAKNNRNSSVGLGQKSKNPINTPKGDMVDSQVYTSIADMINGPVNNDVGGFSNLLDSLAAKNKRYFTIIKDYEIMPILIPQINRVLMFLTNECLSPDIQNKQTFKITYLPDKDDHRIQVDIARIKEEMKLDNLLREVITNRYKLGNEYYTVIDYNDTYQHMLDMMEAKGLNESTAGMSDLEYVGVCSKSMQETINECSIKLNIDVHVEKDNLVELAKPVELNFDSLNIKIERSSMVESYDAIYGELLAEAYSKENRLARLRNGIMNEAVVDNTKLTDIVNHMKAKKLQRCTIDRLDPARMFKLKVGGKIIGYFYVRDMDENTSNVINFAQSLKDQLMKSRVANMNTATANAEEVISKELAEKIINTFDPNIGINRIEDIDLLHDYIRNTEIFRGNKRITFYYEDEIFDLSRTDGSLLTNAVFFTKLYATLLLNNIMTKVLRGRGRQFHYVRTGVSPSIQRYIQNAIVALTMPENNLGTLHGSFEQILNPYNSSSDIILPVEDGTDKYIETDYVPGQDVDMNDEFLRFLLNSIVSAFGLDSAVIDATNGNLQFARTLSMESLQICNSVINEQQDLHDNWERLVLEVLRIMGSDDTKSAIDQNMIKVEFFEPETLIIQNTIEDLNNVKNYAENIADIIPEFNEDGAEVKRSKFIYTFIKERLNIDWDALENLMQENAIDQVDDQMQAEIRTTAREYKENTQEREFGEKSYEEETLSDDSEYGEFEPDESDNDLY